MIRRLLVLLLLLPPGLLMAQQINYDIDTSLNLATYSLQGNCTITLETLPPGGSARIKAMLSPGISLNITSAAINGSPVSLAGSGSFYALPLEGLTAPVQIDLTWQIEELPEVEGIILLDDSTEFGWYPKLTGPANANIKALLLVAGEGRLASNAYASTGEDIGGMREYVIKAEDSLILAASPIFSEIRTFAGSTSVGVFMRQGADTWKNRLLGSASEIVTAYEQLIPSYAPDHLDIVVAAREHPCGFSIPGMVVLEDVIDQFVEDLGAVFTANFIRWELSIGLAGAHFADAIACKPDSRWIVDGLALLYAEKYAQSILLGGPAFDNIKSQYLSALLNGTTVDLSAGFSGDLRLAASKGFWLMGMLERKVGRQAFESLVYKLLDADLPVSGNDLERLAQSASGDNLSAFFGTWLRGDPKADLEIIDIGQGDAGVELVVNNPLPIELPLDIAATLTTGQRVVSNHLLPPGRSEITLAVSSQARRIVLDPERIYPDTDRGNNNHIFGDSRAIEQLYFIDNLFTIGDLELVSTPVVVGNQRAADFRLTITNLREETARLGLHLTANFPRVRNRGLSKLFIELAPGETRTIQDVLFMPLKGSGVMTVKAEYFIVSSRDQYDAIDRSTSPSLVSWYAFNIESK